MIVVTHLATLVLLWCRRRGPPRRGCGHPAAAPPAGRGANDAAATMPLLLYKATAAAAGVEAVCAVLLWAWSFHFISLPRVLWAGLAVATFIHTLLLTTTRPARLLRGHLFRSPTVYAACVVYPKRFTNAITCAVAPAAPFLTIWRFGTPLSLLAPGVHFTLFRVFPAGIVVLTLAAMVYTAVMEHRAARGLADPVIISQLHRTSFLLGGTLLKRPAAGVAMPIAPGRALRGDASYIHAVLLSDLGMSTTTPRAAIAALARAVAAGEPELVLLTGAVFSGDLELWASIREGDRRDHHGEARTTAIDAYVTALLHPLADPLARGRVYYAPGVDLLGTHGWEGPAHAAFVRALTARGGVVLSPERPGALVEVPLRVGDGAPPAAAAAAAAAATAKVYITAAPIRAGHAADVAAAADYRLGLARSAAPFLSGSMDACHAVLCGGANGGVAAVQLGGVDFSVVSIAAAVLGRTFCPHGLWGRGPARCLVSRGVGSAGLAPPCPGVRLGAPPEALYVALEVPPPPPARPALRGAMGVAE